MAAPAPGDDQHAIVQYPPVPLCFGWLWRARHLGPAPPRRGARQQHHAVAEQLVCCWHTPQCTITAYVVPGHAGPSTGESGRSGGEKPCAAEKTWARLWQVGFWESVSMGWEPPEVAVAPEHAPPLWIRQEVGPLLLSADKGGKKWLGSVASQVPERLAPRSNKPRNNSYPRGGRKRKMINSPPASGRRGS